MKLTTSQWFLAAAGVMILLGVLLTASMMSPPAPTEDPKDDVETRKLVVVTAPVQAGEAINADALAVVDWPKALYPDEDSVFEDTLELEGRIARKALLPGEPLYIQKIAAAQTKAGLTVAIPPGMRAVTLAVDDIKGVAGFIKPGDRVDVIAKVRVEVKDQDIDVSRTILQNRLVLAVEQTKDDDRIAAMETLEVAASDNERAEKNRERGKEPPPKKADEKEAKPAKNITLALWPGEAESLDLAEEMGELRLALRNEEDVETAITGGATDTELFRSAAARGYVPEDAKSYGPPADLAPLADFDDPDPSADGPSYLYSVEVVEGSSRRQVAF